MQKKDFNRPEPKILLKRWVSIQVVNIFGIVPHSHVFGYLHNCLSIHCEATPISGRL